MLSIMSAKCFLTSRLGSIWVEIDNKHCIHKQENLGAHFYSTCSMAIHAHIIFPCDTSIVYSVISKADIG
jgi:3-polyprenyl-4-hydroxybenzoate decarboxylase